MPTLSITKSYANDQLLSASDIDNIIDDVETFVNVTGLNDDNIQGQSITGRTKLKTATVTSAKLASSAVTSAKFSSGAVTTDKILNDNVTAAKIADDGLLRSDFVELAPLASPGTVIMFHTFNGAVSVPRGWMKCDGSAVVESAYNALHGANSYEEDDVQNSPILGNFMPNMVNKYARGSTATTQAGATSISSNGNTNNQADLSHDHNVPSHNHTVTNDALASLTGFGPQVFVDRRSVDPTFVANTVSSQDVSEELSSSQDIRPESVEFIFIMKVV